MQIYLLAADGTDSMWPLSTTGTIGAIQFGPLTFSELQYQTLTAAGLQVSAVPASGRRLNLFTTSDSWLSRDAAAFCRDYPGEAIFVDSDDHAVAFRALGDAPSVDGPRVPVVGAARRIRYPWHLLDVVAGAAADFCLDAPLPKGAVHPQAVIDGELWCDAGTTVLPGVFVEGTVIVGRNCKIGPNCYLRGPLFIGNDCRVGQAVELKGSLLMNRVAVGHLSYVGDTVIADRVNFGAGTITANLRHDGSSMRSAVAGALVATGRRKLGAIIGEGVHTGIHTAIYPGRKLGAGAGTRPGEVVSIDLHSPES